MKHETVIPENVSNLGPKEIDQLGWISNGSCCLLSDPWKVVAARYRMDKSCLSVTVVTLSSASTLEDDN
jgi:hypothetical protein